MALNSLYQEIIHKSRYAKFIPDLKRRESWNETVDRYAKHFKLNKKQKQAILDMDDMPSMRAMMTSGPALLRDNTAGYNCAYTVADSLQSIAEIMYILLCGTGVGASVESRYTNKIPTLPNNLIKNGLVHKFEDSKDGWFRGFGIILSNLWAGNDIGWDLSDIRPEGEPLKIFGGHASGPEPLNELLKFVRSMVKKNLGKKLKPWQIADIICKIADVVVSGGVRRSALIILFDLFDDEMMHYKHGEWWNDNPQRRLANVSAVFETKPTKEQWIRFWKILATSGSGEPGIFSRYAAIEKVKSIGRDHNFLFGFNPCGEIILRPYQFCNLSDVVVRFDDTYDTVSKKVTIASELGTKQSTLVELSKLSPEWEKNCKEERLLGVSMTGICDNEFFSTPSDDLNIALESLRLDAILANDEEAYRLGIPASAAITCVKPSGTVSQLVDSSSGVHPRYAEYYIRRITMTKSDPLTQFLMTQGIIWEDSIYNDRDVIFSFPMKAPKNCKTRHDMDASSQLKLWETYAEHWCDHNPSVTVYVKEDEWEKIGEYVYDNFDKMIGIAFLPYDGGTYKQAPYEEITEKQYIDMVKLVPKSIDWSLFVEDRDNTTGSQELACVGGACEIR